MPAGELHRGGEVFVIRGQRVLDVPAGHDEGHPGSERRPREERSRGGPVGDKGVTRFDEVAKDTGVHGVIFAESRAGEGSSWQVGSWTAPGDVRLLRKAVSLLSGAGLEPVVFAEWSEECTV